MIKTAQSNFLFPFSLLLAASTLLLIVAGGLVTSHEAGLAVPDWPLSYGQLMPPMVGNIFWEHGHRMIAGTVGIMTLLFAISVQVQPAPVRLKRLAWIMLGAVLLQAILGGLTVIYMLPAPISILHACLAQTFFCLTVATAFLLSPYHPFDVRFMEDEGIRRIARLTVAVIFLQLVLGATVRHTGAGIVVHVVTALGVFVHAGVLVARITRSGISDRVLTWTAAGLAGALVAQLFLGMGALIFTQLLERSYAPSQAEVLFTVAHQTLGAVIFAASVLLALVGYQRCSNANGAGSIAGRI